MPDLYGDYEVESFLGKGSIGKVFLARHRRIGRRVALKTVILEQKFEDEQDQREFYRRLQREAELCASMQHPNIVTLYDVGYEGDVVTWLATEYVDGESLLAHLRRTNPLPLEKALSLAADLLRGLGYAHSKGIIHRDIKPANILLTSAGQAKIADFGVARPLHSSLTATRSLVGTPNYMSPEQVKTTAVSTRSDLFSAGTVMYEMLAGRRPFLSPDLSGILYNVVNLDPPLASSVNPQVPEPVAHIVARLMAKQPDQRYATAEEALAELMSIREGRATFASSQSDETIATVVDPHVAPQTILRQPSQSASTSTKRDPPLLHRRIPTPLFWAASAALAAALAGSIAGTLNYAERLETPTGEITREQQQRSVAKARELTSLRALLAIGRFDEAIAGYDRYLARYPESRTAHAERAEAQRLLEESTPKTTVTRTARKPRPAAEDAPAKRPSRWDRVKRWFRGT